MTSVAIWRAIQVEMTHEVEIKSLAAPTLAVPPRCAQATPESLTRRAVSAVKEKTKIPDWLQIFVRERCRPMPTSFLISHQAAAKS